MSLEARAEPYVVRPGEAREEVDAVVARLRWLVRGEESGGAFNLIDYQAPGRFAGPGVHVHRDEDEALFVLEGTLTIRQGEEEADLGPGGFAWQPRGISHGFANRTDEPARFLLLISPAHLEEMFREIAAYVQEAAPDVDPNKMIELNERHGVEVVGPPIGAE